jgi:hypothetical protein
MVSPPKNGPDAYRGFLSPSGIDHFATDCRANTERGYFCRSGTSLLPYHGRSQPLHRTVCKIVIH